MFVVPVSSFAWDNTGVITSVTVDNSGTGNSNSTINVNGFSTLANLDFYDIDTGTYHGHAVVGTAYGNNNKCTAYGDSTSGCNGGVGTVFPTTGDHQYIVYAHSNYTCNGQTQATCASTALGSFKIRNVGNSFNNPNFVTNSLVTYGCTNPVALNYNPLADSDDGTCTFNSNPNGTSSPVGTNGQLAIATDSNGKNFWYRTGATRYRQDVTWTSKNYVYVFIEGNTLWSYNQVYVYGSSTLTNLATSFTNPDIVRSFTVDGRTISIYRLYTVSGKTFPTFEMNLFGTTGATSSTRIYGVIPSDSFTAPSPTDQASMYSYLTSYSDNSNPIWYSPMSTYNYAPVQTTNYPKTLTFPAQLYSMGALIQNPVTTTSYSFTAPPVQVLNGVQQGGVVFIAHDPAMTPVITWGSKVMTRIDTSNGTVDGYKLSVYHVKNPVASSTIYLTSLGTPNNRIRYIQASIWDFGELLNTYDKYTVNTTSNRAWIDLANTINPFTTIGSILTTNINGYDKLADTVVRRSYSNTAGTSSYAMFSRVCSGQLFDGCDTGYTNQWNFGSVAGEVIGVSMYSTIQATSTVITSINLNDPVFKLLVPDESKVNFADCFTEMNNYGLLDVGFYKAMTGASVCVLRNTGLWVFQLFIPTSSQIATLSTDLVAKMQDGKMFSTALGMPFYIFSLTSTSTPITEVSYYNITVPSSISGGTYATTSFPIKVKVGVMASSTDRGIANFIEPFFAVFGIFLGGFLLLKVLH